VKDRFDSGITRADVGTVRVVQAESLLEREEMLGLVVTAERLHDYFVACSATPVAVFCEDFGVMLPRNDATDYGKTGLAGDVRQNPMDLDVHLIASLLHALDLPRPPLRRAFGDVARTYEALRIELGAENSVGAGRTCAAPAATGNRAHRFCDLERCEREQR
jgi:hypothetical protein